LDDGVFRPDHPHVVGQVLVHDGIVPVLVGLNLVRAGEPLKECLDIGWV